MSDDHNDRPVTAKEYRWLHGELLLLQNRVRTLEDDVLRLRERPLRLVTSPLPGDAEGEKR